MQVTLRPYQVSDADDVLEWARDDEVSGPTRMRPINTKQDAVDYLEQEAIPHPWHRAICLDGRPVGYVMFDLGSGLERYKGYVGYALGVKYWGRGVMTKVVKMVVPILFEVFPEIVRVEAYVDVRNVASQRTLEKAGFVKEGVLRKFWFFKGEHIDFALYSVLSTDPMLS